MSGAETVVAASIRAEKRLVEALRDAGAFSAEAAIALQHGRFMQHGALRRLLRHGAIHEVQHERYWLDESAYQTLRKHRQGRIGLIVLGLLAALIIASIGVARAEAQIALSPSKITPSSRAI